MNKYKFLPLCLGEFIVLFLCVFRQCWCYPVFSDPSHTMTYSAGSSTQFTQSFSTHVKGSLEIKVLLLNKSIELIQAKYT